MKLNFRSKGMTLIEVVVVVAIIAILSAIAIPAYGTYTTKAGQEQNARGTDNLVVRISLCACEWP